MNPKPLLLTVIGLTLGAPTAHAEAEVDADRATEIVRGSVKKALQVLENPKLQGAENRSARFSKLRSVSDDVFDWREMSQRSLGVHWRKLDDAQKERFTTTFEDLLANHYLKQIDRFSGQEKVKYVGTEDSTEGVVVKMKIITKSREQVPIHFFVGEDMKVYDVAIEGVSIANHYRGSFNRLLVNEDFETMMKKLERKVRIEKKLAERQAQKSDENDE